MTTVEANGALGIEHFGDATVGEAWAGHMPDVDLPSNPSRRNAPAGVETARGADRPH